MDDDQNISDDQNANLDDSNQQLQEGQNGNGSDGGQSTTPTEVELEGGVKVSRETLDKWARDAYKDRFDAFDNREKWTAENTRKAQEIAQIKREAIEYRRLMQDPRFRQQTQPQNVSDQFVHDLQQQFPDVDPRFLKAMGGWMEKFAGQTVEKAIQPLTVQQGEAFERQFLAAHPDVVRGSQQYQEIADLIGRGVDAEQAYKLVCMDRVLESAIKKRDLENAERLKKSRQRGGISGQKKPAASFDEAFEDVWSEVQS